MDDSYKYLIAEITSSDEPFLWEMLYQAIHVPAGSVAPPRQIVNSPELSRYVEQWGQKNDFGLKAVSTDDQQPVGAVWLRLMTGENRGYGYIDDLTPELSIAVFAEHRGKGVGTRLLNELFESITGKHKSISLSVSDDNPAKGLYQRLGFVIVSREGTSLTMKKNLV
ncbi:MAG TPA: GNAT family N-acetyltransferase [Blastocatellia bacterium]|nr:GNAT family N-acetyltransferase [Blastocatellia bacterium]